MLCVREVKLSQGFRALVSQEDYLRVRKYRWYADRHGAITYAKTDQLPNRPRLHQFIIGTNGVDHIDGDGLNNTRQNLRKVTNSENLHNTKFHRNGTSGIWYNKTRDRYEVTVTIRYKKHYIGVYTSFEEAKKARENARKNLGL